MQISRAHASLAATIAFVLGALVTWMAPAMIRDIREWHREFYGTRKPADEPGQQQPAQGSGFGKNASIAILPQACCEDQARERFQLIRGGGLSDGA